MDNAPAGESFDQLVKYSEKKIMNKVNVKQKSRGAFTLKKNIITRSTRNFIPSKSKFIMWSHSCNLNIMD